MALPKIFKNIENRVKKTGDTIQGQLDVNWPYMSFDNQHGKFHVNDWEFNIYAKKPEQGEDYTRFMISNPYVSDDSGLLRVNSIKNGETTSYKIYGEHNKPSSTALGFTKGSGYSTLITTWSQLGLSTGSVTSVKQIVETMPTEAVAILACDVTLKNNGVTPSSYGLLKIFKSNNSYSSCEFTASDSAENWIGYYNIGSGAGIYWSGWQKTQIDKNFGLNICTENQDTVDFWANLQSGYCWISGLNVLKNQPYQWGLLKSYVLNKSWVIQEFYVANTPNEGKIYRRYGLVGRNNNLWEDNGGWTVILDDKNYNRYTPSLTGAGATGYWGDIEVPKSRLLSKFTMYHDPENRAGYRLILSKTVTSWRNYRAVLGVSSRHAGNGVVCLSFGCDSSEVSDNTAYGEITYYGSANVGLTAAGGTSNSGGVFQKDMFLLYYNNSNKTFYLFAKYYDYNTIEITLLGHQTSGGDYIVITDFINGEFGTSINSSTYGKLVCQTNKGWSEGDTMTAPSGTDYGTNRVRNTSAGTSGTPVNNGDIFVKY